MLFWWKWPLRALGLVVFGLFVYLIISVVQVLTASQVSQMPSAVSPAAAIVVMSPAGGSSTLTADQTNRLEQALTLFQSGRAPMVIVTGGRGRSGTLATAGVPPAGTEVGAEVRYLRLQGLGSSHIELAAGVSDGDALTEVAKLVGHAVHTGLAGAAGHAGQAQVIIVADPLASLRLRATAAGDGLVPEISPATPPAAGFWSDVGEVWNQGTAVAVGRVFGFSSVDWASS